MQVLTLTSHTLWHVCTNPNVCTSLLPVPALMTANEGKNSEKQHSHCLLPLTHFWWDAGKQSMVLHPKTNSICNNKTLQTCSVLKP